MIQRAMGVPIDQDESTITASHSNDYKSNDSETNASKLFRNAREDPFCVLCNRITFGRDSVCANAIR
jgi:hypothetical protein